MNNFSVRLSVCVEGGVGREEKEGGREEKEGGREIFKVVGRYSTGLSLGYEYRKKSDFGPMHSNSTILVGFFPTGSILRLWPSSQSWN